MGCFYLVSTPIGNLKDITLRAIEVLKAVDVVVCEDTRETQKLLYCYLDKQHLPQLLSYTEHNRNQRIPQILQLLLLNKNIAFVADRGTPIISDPGYKLWQQIEKLTQSHPQITIEVIPGASAILPALQLSGLPPDKFYFVGFLPKKESALIKLLDTLPQVTIIAFESPYRLTNTLHLIQKILGVQIKIAICRELTKVHQQVIRGEIGQVIQNISQHPIKGEITLVFHPLA